jgi:hypothetical protein
MSIGIDNTTGHNKARAGLPTNSAGTTPEKDYPMTTQLYFDYDQLTSAYEQAAQHDMPQAWRNALERAFDLLLASDGITVEYGPMGDILQARIPSQSEPGRVYEVNGHCQCEAGQRGQPCAHRAAKRLLNIAHEQQSGRRVVNLPAMQRLAADDLLKPEDDRPRHMTAQQWAAEKTARAYAASGIGDLFPD